MPNLCHTNRVIVAYVIALVRIHLYDFLDQLREIAIYCDTYSFIFIQQRSEPSPIASGYMLGDMQSVLKRSEHIAEFINGVPKNYAYRVIVNEGEKSVCKFRGITLNYYASHLVNFELSSEMN